MNAATITRSFSADIDAAIEVLEDDGVLFTVAEEAVVTASGKAIPNRKALVNERTGGVISVVGAKYKSISNIEIFDGFAESILKSGIDTSGMSLDVRKSDARSLVKFTFPAETIRVPGDASATALQIAVLNSFDGSTRFLTKAGGLRVACTNGNILGSIVGAYSAMHNDRLDVNRGAEQIVRMMQDFRGASEYWGAMMMRPVSREESRLVIAKFLNVDPASEEWQTLPRVEKLLTLSDAYAREMGRNAYALYNAITDYISHRGERSGSAASAGLQVENRLIKLLDTSPVFKVGA